MGFFGRLLGVEDETDRARARQQSDVAPRPVRGEPTTEANALERYRYLLRTAPPETIEQAHAEAFAKLSADERRQVLTELSNAAPPAERASVAATSLQDPQALARVATRAEVREPGTLERTLGGGFGMGAGLLSSFAMGFVGSMVAQSFFSALSDGFGGGSEEALADDAKDGNNVDDQVDASEDDGLGEDDFSGDDFDV